MTRLTILTATILLALLQTTAQIPEGSLFRRMNRVSNFEFTLHNDGSLFGDWSYETPGSLYSKDMAYWPRGSFHMMPAAAKGFMLLAGKGGKRLVSDAGVLRPSTRSHGPFDSMVPGQVGDPRAGYDSVWSGAGWLYVDDPNYVVYSSLDYDSNGVDVSGSNFHDWPVRWVDGVERYVSDPLERRLYRPVVRSDEDMFTVFKDTDVRADRESANPNFPDEPNLRGPIGIEVHCYVYSWARGPGKDIVVFRYDVLNKSGVPLDSCYVAFFPGLAYDRAVGSTLLFRSPALKPVVHTGQPSGALVVVQPADSSRWYGEWVVTPSPPVLGYPLLESPRGYDGRPVGLARALTVDTVDVYLDVNGKRAPLSWTGNDSTITANILSPPPWLYEPPYLPANSPYALMGVVLLSGPFPMASGDTARFTTAYIFAEDVAHLLLLDEFLWRVYFGGFQEPEPPPVPQLTGRGLNRGVQLSWDRAAEAAVDPVIPDSLGEAFMGYRLYRATSRQGPFVEIGHWRKDSVLAHEYLDRGEDIGGLKNNVGYYYHLLSFDGGAVRLNLDPMSSPVKEGVNSIMVIPEVESPEVRAGESRGEVAAGTLGGVVEVRLVPREMTNFVRMVSGRDLEVRIETTTDGERYLLPVAVRDTVSGLEETGLLDPGLMVHGSPSIAGVKEGDLRLEDIFGIGAADVAVAYRFEQLSEPFRVEVGVETGADVPIIVYDSLAMTGIVRVTPYTSAGREVEVEFLEGGIDTLSVLSNRYTPYLRVKVWEGGRELVQGEEYEFRGTGILSSGGVIARRTPGRYYLSGRLSNGEEWDFGHELKMYETVVGFDYGDHGMGSGKPSPYFMWGSPHREGTRDFAVGDRVRVHWVGGVKAEFPRGAKVMVQGAMPTREEVTEQTMERIRIVPNPYIVRHEAQRTDERLYFNYLPEECEIRIYTVSLDLVRVLKHLGGSREEWDLRTAGGERVASQVLMARIEAPNGAATIRKFSVIVGK